jgi:urea carboxylase-associated protein 2
MNLFTTEKVLYEENLPGGWNWSHVLKRGTCLRIVDPEGGACAALLVYNPKEPSERFNMPDTLKAQFTARLGTGHGLYSDMGRVLMSILSDSFGGHDPLGGTLDQKNLEARFGARRYQEARNAYHRSGRLALLTELAKYGMNERDLVPPVNFFSRVDVMDSGEFSFRPEAVVPGCFVDLQAEMDVLVVLAATQHPLDPRPHWEPRPLQLVLWNSNVAPSENPAFAYNEQNQRGFFNTSLYQL